jgi:hypothetical protein
MLTVFKSPDEDMPVVRAAVLGSSEFNNLRFIVVDILEKEQLHNLGIATPDGKVYAMFFNGSTQITTVTAQYIFFVYHKKPALSSGTVAPTFIRLMQNLIRNTFSFIAC